MRIADVAKLDWKQDKDLLAVERKMDGMIQRESQCLSRLAWLEKSIRESEESLIQARVATLLEESSGEQQEVIQQRLSSCRGEIEELQADLEAIRLAKKKLEPAVASAQFEAKLRLAQILMAPYRETAESLRGVLEKAAELNRILHQVHTLTVKQKLTDVIHGNKAMKPLSMLAAWNLLTVPDGRISSEFQYWRDYLDKIFAEN